MTADLVNLRQVRKAKARGEAAEKAAGNRAKFGRSGAERSRQAISTAMDARRLDQHRLSDPCPTGDVGDHAG